MKLETGFGEIDIPLNAAEDFVTNGSSIAEADDDFAFELQGRE